MKLVSSKRFEGFLTASSITDIYYMIQRFQRNHLKSREMIRALCTLFSLLDTEAVDIRQAIESRTEDFEDAVMIETAKRSKIDYIITRNISDYANSQVSVLSPEDFLASL